MTDRSPKEAGEPTEPVSSRALGSGPLGPLAVIFATVFIDLVGFGVIIPLLPFYAEHFDASPDVVALLMATYSCAQFLCAPLWGGLSDRFGRKPILMTTLFGIGLGYIWIGFAGALWQLFAARALSGAMAGNIAAAQAYVADVTPPEKRAKGMGLIGAAFGLGFTLGPAIGGGLGGSDPVAPNFQAPAFTSAGLSLLAFAFAALVLKESLTPERRAELAHRRRPNRFVALSQAVRTPGVGLLILLFFLVTFVFAGMEATFAMWSERTFGWGPRHNGYLFAFVGLLGAAIQGGAVGWLSRRFGEARLITQGAVALAVGLGLLPVIDSVPALFTAMAVLAYGAAVANPSLHSLISRRAGEQMRGSTLGVSQSAASLARIAGPAFAGALFAAFGRDWPYVAGACVMLLVVLFSLRVAQPARRLAEPEQRRALD